MRANIPASLQKDLRSTVNNPVGALLSRALSCKTNSAQFPSSAPLSIVSGYYAVCCNEEDVSLDEDAKRLASFISETSGEDWNPSDVTLMSILISLQHMQLSQTFFNAAVGARKNHLHDAYIRDLAVEAPSWHPCPFLAALELKSYFMSKHAVMLRSLAMMLMQKASILNGNVANVIDELKNVVERKHRDLQVCIASVVAMCLCPNPLHRDASPSILASIKAGHRHEEIYAQQHTSEAHIAGDEGIANEERAICSWKQMLLRPDCIKTLSETLCDMMRQDRSVVLQVHPALWCVACRRSFALMATYADALVNMWSPRTNSQILSHVHLSCIRNDTVSEYLHMKFVPLKS